MLWVAAEFYNVKVPIVALKQMRLGPAAHFPDQAGGVDAWDTFFPFQYRYRGFDDQCGGGFEELSQRGF